VAGQARAVTGKVEMATLMLIIGSIVLFAGAVGAWYTVWHLRIESRLERIPVDGRSAHVPRQGVASGSDQQ
jgi:hypothetical protein